jgi:hypothetical protein
MRNETGKATSSFGFQSVRRFDVAGARAWGAKARIQ